MIGLILIVWGSLFGGIPFLIILFDILEGEFDLLLTPILAFPIIGITAIIIGLNLFIKYIKLKLVEKDGIETTANFVSMESNCSVNGVPKYLIRYTYNDEKGYKKQDKTLSKYNYEEAMFYSNIKQFKIKYKGKLSVITEKPAFPSNYNSNHDNTYNQQPSNWTYYNGHLVREKSYYYVCEYCGSSQKKLGKCKSCGAKIVEHCKREEV